MVLEKILGALGIVAIMLTMWIISDNKRKFPWKVVLWGLIIQFSLAVFVLYIPVGVEIFKWLGDKVSTFLDFSKNGSNFLFGKLPSDGQVEMFGFQFAIIVTATIIFFSSIVSILYHWGVMQKIVHSVAWVMQKTMGTSGVESLSASANIFIGQTEAPLLIRHYLSDVSRSELNSIMTVGFATIAGGVLAAYVSMGISPTYLITAAVISAPGGLMLSKIVIPQTNEILTLKDLNKVEIPKHENVLLALTNGASDGLKLSLNIMAMLLAFISIIAVLDAGLLMIDEFFTGYGVTFLPSSFKEILGYVFQPFAYLVGIPSEEARIFGQLFGTKMSVNEFIAFADLSRMIEAGEISKRTATLATFALCGFANFSSIAIQIGGLGSLVPEKKAEIAKLGFRAMVIGSFTNLLTATIAGLMI
jgi:CNT family concentrative nucleoside transporter